MADILSQPSVLVERLLEVSPSPAGRGWPEGPGEGRMGDKSRFSSPNLDRSRELRRKQTQAERCVWYVLRDRKTLGLKFRRQVPIEDFIVDFYCDELKLVVELDGDVHNWPARMARDKRRDERLVKLGYKVLRISNGLATKDPGALREMIRSLRPSPGASRHPLPEGEGL